jgi:SAM-dependent methyltransferase
LPHHCPQIYNRTVQSEIKPATILRHAYGIYPSAAMLAGMQLDLFTPLKDGPMTAAALAKALSLPSDRLRPLLYALVRAELLRLVEGDRFANTPEADLYLVRGRDTYLGSTHELYSDLWRSALTAGQSIRTDRPQVKHDFTAMSDEELGAFFRGLHSGALATGRQLATTYDFAPLRSLLDVGGGSGGVSIAACQNCSALRATIIELPKVAPIAEAMVREAQLTDRVTVLAADILEDPPEGRFGVAVLRNLIQVLGPDAARRALRNVGQVIDQGGWLFIVGLAPAEAVYLNLAFLSVYDEGQAYTEQEHRTWLAEAGFTDVDVRYSAGPGAASIVSARKG